MVAAVFAATRLVYRDRKRHPLPRQILPTNSIGQSGFSASSLRFGYSRRDAVPNAFEPRHDGHVERVPSTPAPPHGVRGGESNSRSPRRRVGVDGAHDTRGDEVVARGE